MSKRADELRQVAELVADCIGRHEMSLHTGEPNDYRPTITDAAIAAAFDSAMEQYGCPTRAWRGTPKSDQKSATESQLRHRAARFSLCVACSEPLAMHSREQTLVCATVRS